MKITLSLARSDGGRVLQVVLTTTAALVVEPAVPRRLEAVEGPGRLSAPSASELHRREIKYHNMKITLSLARSDGGRVLQVVVVAAVSYTHLTLPTILLV